MFVETAHIAEMWLLVFSSACITDWNAEAQRTHLQSFEASACKGTGTISVVQQLQQLYSAMQSKQGLLPLHANDQLVQVLHTAVPALC